MRVLRAFDASGFLESEVHDAGGLGVLNRWKRNDRGDTTSYIDPTQEVTTYAYDGIGRSVSIIEPGGAGSTLSYSPEGLVAEEEVSGGVVLNYGHSDAGLTASVESTASPSVAPLPKHEYEYDALGRLVRARRPGSDISRVYDSQGRLVRESHNGFQCEIRYDDLAGVIERHWPDGRVERQFVDLNGFTTRIDVTAAGVLGEGPATLASYAAQGPSRPDSGELRTVAPFTFAYDERARLVAQSYAGPGGINESCAYRYDSAGRRRVTRHEQAPALVRYHGFDTRDRLLLAAEEFAGPPLGSGRSQGEHDAAIADYASASATAAIMREFEYDASDTRTRAREAGAADVVYAQSAGHRLTAAGAETFTYHDIGTRKSDASRKFDVDAVGRVIAVRDHAGGLRASLEYDALGRPWRVTDATGRVREYRYFGDELWQEDADGQPIRQFTPHPFFPRCSLAVHRESKTYALLHDAVGTMIGAIDGAGAVVERYRYRPFGLPSIYGPDGTPRQQSLVGIEPVFAGMRYLPEVELYLTKARLMDPVHGVFLSIDPMGHRDSPNPYAYAAQNPIDLIDPDGELAFLGFLVIVGVGALVAGGMNAVRQGAQMIDDPEKEFSWGELAVSAGLGGALAPVLVVAPELAVPLAGYGVASGVSELAQGNITTGSF
ncbi:MAG: RHS repeat-associated core domain-containing protein, partial [Actinomycetota bacterium]